MQKAKAILGLIAGVMLILSAAAHSLLGGKAMSQQLSAFHLPPDLLLGVLIGWHFGGVAMLVFGLIALVLFGRRLKGRETPAFPVVIIGVFYLAFGLAALVISGFNPFYTVFVIPALLLLAGSR